MTPANLALRFLLELSALAALGYWGAHTGANLAMRIGLAVAAPLVAAVAWGVVVSPKPRLRVTAPVRLAVELAVFGAGVWALLATGRPRWATLFGAAVALHELWRAAGPRRPARGVPRAR